MSNYYKSFQKASDSNWQLLVDIFNESKFKLIKPSKINSCNDGVLVFKNKIIIIEVKRRQFDQDDLMNKFEGKFFLEKSKYNSLHKVRTEYKSKYRGKEVLIWYLTKTSDGMIYLYDITDKTYKWVKRPMKLRTYEENPKTINKTVTYLSYEDTFKTIRTKITN